MPLTLGKERLQIRIPKDEYECLKEDIIDMLLKECLPIVKEKFLDEKDFDDTHFWKNCGCYIFEFEAVELQLNVVYGYDGPEEYGKSITFLEYKHPFIKEMINSNEGSYWTEKGFDKKIRKYQHIDKVIVAQL